MTHKTLLVVITYLALTSLHRLAMADTPKTDFTVLISNPNVPQVAFDKLKDYGIEVLVADADTREAIKEKIPGVDAIFWASHNRLDADILDVAGPQMKTVCTMSVGYDHIDLQELKKRGIKLANTPEVLNDAVADIAILLTLAASRRMHEGRLAIESGNWRRSLTWMLGRDIQGSTVGILGFGRIGKTIAKRLQSFDVGKIYYTHREDEEGKALKATFVPFDTLIEESDFIISSLPLSNRTANMFNDELFSRMKNTCVFVNVGRGGLVDQPALVRALKEGKIFAAGLDVMTPEPLPTDSELLTIPNLVLMPHLGSATVNTRNEMADLTARNILRALGGAEMFTPVEF